MNYITINTSSDCDPVTYAIDTDEERDAAKVALRDAGLAYEDVWTSPTDEDFTESYKTGDKLFGYSAGQGPE